ncbi:MAG: hypothetical protein II180_13920 [Proteobacteria bacterium]|nr:hypothetical protein [Pseudomonadota bacterium]
MHKIMKMLAVCAPLLVCASATAQDSVDPSQNAGTAEGAVAESTENSGGEAASSDAGVNYDDIFGSSSNGAVPAGAVPAGDAPAGDAVAEAPASEAPVAEAPASDAVAEAPASEAPAGDAVAEAPASEAPAGDAVAEAPASEAPAGDAASVESSGGASGATEENAVMTAALLDKQLHEVSTSLDTLKEDTFATKSRLLLLREEVLQRAVSGARVQLRYEDEMGGQYDLTQVYYAIDRETVFSGTGEGLKKLDGELIYDRMLAPGAHQLSVVYVYKGRPWGVFRYMTDYTFRVESGYDFVVDEGKSAELIVVATEQGNAFTAYEERPNIKFKYQQYDLVAGSKEDQ